MGKSTVSCLKIITCGSDSVGHDDLQNTETKDSPDWRGWSFRKRSARHRVLSSTVISEAASSANKESPESTPVNFQVQPNLTVPEKTSVIQWAGEKTELSASPNSKLPVNTGAKEDDSRGDTILDESSIIVIQAAVRRCLAQRVLLKQKNIIKLQAVVRGHLVRRHAVGTLRCVQAIVKMQTLFRARQARQCLVQGSGDEDKQSGSSGKGNHDSMLSSWKLSLSQLVADSSYPDFHLKGFSKDLVLTGFPKKFLLMPKFEIKKSCLNMCRCSEADENYNRKPAMTLLLTLSDFICLLLLKLSSKGNNY